MEYTVQCSDAAGYELVEEVHSVRAVCEWGSWRLEFTFSNLRKLKL
jgi:hypothetical protein